MKIVLILAVVATLAGCAAGQSTGCGAAMGLAAGCAEGQNPIPYGD